jgi:hypothetical protein
MPNPVEITITARTGHTLRLDRSNVTLILVGLDTLAGHKAAPIEARQEAAALAHHLRTAAIA